MTAMEFAIKTIEDQKQIIDKLIECVEKISVEVIYIDEAEGLVNELLNDPLIKQYRGEK